MPQPSTASPANFTKPTDTVNTPESLPSKEDPLITELNIKRAESEINRSSNCKSLTTELVHLWRTEIFTDLKTPNLAYLLTKRTAGRPQEITVDYAEGQPCVPVTINNICTKAVAGSGAGMSLSSYTMFGKMKVDPSRLTRHQQFNIKTATGLVPDAVLGHVILTLRLTNTDMTTQLVQQCFLVLRDSFTLDQSLLGRDFLKQNNAIISFNPTFSIVMNGHTLLTCSQYDTVTKNTPINYSSFSPSANPVNWADGEIIPGAQMSNSSQFNPNLPADQEVLTPHIFLSETSGNHDITTTLPFHLPDTNTIPVYSARGI